MRIHCPYCGPRGHEEFVYYGDATIVRPAPTGSDTERAFHDYLYLRDNPAGRHREYWWHVAGCQAWLIVERNTQRHAIHCVTSALNIAPGTRPGT